MSYKFRTITKLEMSKYKKELVKFFGQFKYTEDYSIAIDNSAYISVCWEGDKIVGAGRVVSDLSRFAFIVDLNVVKPHQNKGIGKQLMKDMVQTCLDAKIRYIELSTDPNCPWLEYFYTKIGFVKVADSVLMEWPHKCWL